MRQIFKYSAWIVIASCVVSCSGISKKEYLEKQLSEEFETLMESRNMYVYHTDAEKIFPVRDKNDYFVSCAMPIISEGDIIGCVASLCDDAKQKMSDATEQKLIMTAATFLGKQNE